MLRASRYAFVEPFFLSGVSCSETAMEGSDEALFERVRGGDMPAFDVLYDRYEVRLFAYLRALVGDRRDAEEIFHDAFLAALKSPPTKLEEGGFRAWLYRVARNLALNRIRAAGRRDRAHDDMDDADPPVQADAALENRELGAALAAAVTRLPPALGELYHLRTSGLSYDEIAGVIEVPIGTVKSRMHQMVHALREELSPWTAPE
jgi:RNA polymerase sigma-70 factor (ECF subfamily)